MILDKFSIRLEVFFSAIHIKQVATNLYKWVLKLVLISTSLINLKTQVLVGNTCSHLCGEFHVCVKKTSPWKNECHLQIIVLFVTN